MWDFYLPEFCEKNLHNKNKAHWQNKGFTFPFALVSLPTFLKVFIICSRPTQVKN